MHYYIMLSLFIIGVFYMCKLQIDEMAVLYCAACVIYFWGYSSHLDSVYLALLGIVAFNMAMVMFRKPH
jgi:hypothetical protein